MTIAQRLASGWGPTFSFEFFPPKDDAGEAQLRRTVDELARLGPDFVSVTYGANGSQRGRTLAATRELAQLTQVTTMGHLTCADQSRAQLVEVIGDYSDIGIQHIFAVRGDMPGGPTQPWQAHPEGLANATELVELIRSIGDFCVGVAAFPDPHPSTSDPRLDARLLVDKWRAGASFAITQLFFEPRSYVELVDRVRGLGCPIPIIAGIMPITMVSQVRRFAELSGAPIPSSISSQLEKVSNDPVAVRALGTAIATDLAEQLLDAGAPGLHFFTQNRSLATVEIWQALKMDRG
ncbi:MAG: methylenetetrahydrofolate reductase [NAD(P)H] [Propionibacteriaceae bacterium]|jgi:methylenetetrahydrofolate reductase (NADPH)|nr:methylenetetrahydrofolate reductase [NAD(P)H] [Propionibacteriaceae bacterium]